MKRNVLPQQMQSRSHVEKYGVPKKQAQKILPLISHAYNHTLCVFYCIILENLLYFNTLPNMKRCITQEMINKKELSFTMY